MTPRVPRPDPEPQPLNRAQAVEGLFQLPALALTLAAKQTESKPELATALLADAATVTTFAKPISEGAAEVAANDPRFAAALDKIIAGGPYAALLIPVAQMGIQIAANHGRIEPGAMGTVSPEELIAITFPPKDSSETDASANGRPTVNVPA